MNWFGRFVSKRTDSVVLGSGVYGDERLTEEGEGAGEKGIVNRVLDRITHTKRRYTNTLFKQRGDRVCFTFCLGIAFYILFSVLIANWFVSNGGDENDLTKLSPILHGSHDEMTQKRTGVSLANLLSLNVYREKSHLPSLFGVPCRKVSNQELVRGKSYSGTSLPLLLEVMCQIVHQDAGCKGSPRSIAPRLVNASELATRFMMDTGRPLQSNVPLDTSSPTVIGEMHAFSDLMFEESKSESPRIDYTLEDLCVITYQDAKGLCYHYFNPEIKLTSGESMSMTVSSNIVQTPQFVEPAVASTIETSVRALTSVFTSIMSEEDQIKHEPVLPKVERDIYYYQGTDTSKISGGYVRSWFDIGDSDPHTMLTITSIFFPFLGRHMVRMAVPIIFQYQPLVDQEHVHAEALDDMIERESKRSLASDVKDRIHLEDSKNPDAVLVDAKEINTVITDYEKHVVSKLLTPGRDSMWLRYLPHTITIGFPPRDRGYQLAMLTEILDGKYLEPSTFDCTE